MEDHKLSILIDQHLLGRITSKEKETLEQLMASDPTVVELVEDSERAFKVLDHVRKKQLKSRLTDLDKSNNRWSFFIGKWWRLFLFLSVAGLGWVYLASYYFVPEAIAKRNFITTSDGTAITDSKWIKAEDAFQKGEFSHAIMFYVILIDEDNINDKSIAQWNMLLAQLALDGPTIHWKMAVESFSKTAPSYLSEKARKLLSGFESGYQRLFLFQLHDNFTTLRPRLI